MNCCADFYLVYLFNYCDRERKISLLGELPRFNTPLTLFRDGCACACVSVNVKYKINWYFYCIPCGLITIYGLILFSVDFVALHAESLLNGVRSFFHHHYYHYHHLPAFFFFIRSLFVNMAHMPITFWNIIAYTLNANINRMSKKINDEWTQRNIKCCTHRWYPNGRTWTAREWENVRNMIIQYAKTDYYL